ncbi:hypothetical protein CC80DRAFT_166826 [Byssothecium circinans]|uniref:Uncharacterized protein n=1 Tax=Byssothecium circinans TaxID=147558 RepID=A0A6A5TJF7_9PLEO|nr:hypothetical protein CC80DRAFT_166826 [Byssothecium circinans]
MATVRDPNFWKRFSIAVHQDEALKEELAKHPELKHTYVTALALSSSVSLDSTTMPSPVATPRSESHILDPTFTNPIPKFSQHPQPMSPVALRPMTAAPSPDSQRPITHPTPPATPPLAHTQPPTRPNRLTKTPTPKSTKSKTSITRPRARSNPFTRHANSSQMTLGLSGRPQSRFKFWTSVSADPSNRDSWLENQQRKSKQRTYMCWGFWGVVACLVAGVVATVLVLKQKGII